MWRPDGKGPLERPGHSWEDNIEWIFKKFDGKAWTGLMRLRTGTGSGWL
jgi:hypothetical protein